LVLLPNRTGIHFFRKALAEEAGKTIWAPECLTPGMHMENVSGLVAGNRIRLAAELHRVYGQILQREPEPFEKFFPWAELLLNDFDDIDKYLADARVLYANLSGLQEIKERFQYLTEEQIALIRRFWQAYELPGITEPKARFLRIWERLQDVYSAYRESLISKGFGYEGLLHRTAVENRGTLMNGLHEYKAAYVIGFNRLNACEKVFFKTLRETIPTAFFYDVHPMAAADELHEGGRFFRETAALFPGTLLPVEESKTKPEVKLIQVTGQTTAVKLAAGEIQNALRSGISERQILLMLPDEKQLGPLLYSLPEELNEINITSGLSLGETPVIALLKGLYHLRKFAREKNENGYFRVSDVLLLLNHPYLNFRHETENRKLAADLIKENRIRPERKQLMIHPLAMVLFALPSESTFTAYVEQVFLAILEEAETMNDYERIVLAFTADNIRSVKQISEEEALPAEDGSALRLLLNVLRSARIPFESDPLNGMQIMGPLETRNLDFSQVFIPAMTDDQFPGSGNTQTYIPYTLRKAFGLPLPEDRAAELCHIFFRLFQRSEKIFLYYNTASGAMTTGEPSRFILRLLAEAEYYQTLDQKILSENVSFIHSEPITVKKEGKAAEALKAFVGENPRALYPTALNTYLSCGLRFYFRYLAGLKEPDEISETADHADFGNMFHQIMEHAYAPFVDREITAADLAGIEAQFDQLALPVFKKQYGYRDHESFEYEGEALLHREVLRKYFQGVLARDREMAPFFIRGLELEGEYMMMPLTFESAGKTFTAMLAGKIDRVDEKDGVTRILDYKTGADEMKYTDLPSLFDGLLKKRNKAAFQTWLYGLIYGHNHKKAAILQAGVISVKKLFGEEDADPILKKKEDPAKRNSTYRRVNNLHDEAEDFEELLRKLLGDLFDENKDFAQTEDTERCRTCPYNGICKR
jgi:hypothetical protein